jgi:hypothetical protein
VVVFLSFFAPCRIHQSVSNKSIDTWWVAGVAFAEPCQFSGFKEQRDDTAQVCGNSN